MRIIEYSKIAFQNLLNWFWNTKFPVPPPRSLNKYSTAKRKEGGKKNNLQTKAVVPAKYTFLECLNKLKALQLTFLLVKKTIEEEKASGGWSTREREEGNDPKIDRLQAVKSRPMAMGGERPPVSPTRVGGHPCRDPAEMNALAVLRGNHPIARAALNLRLKSPQQTGRESTAENRCPPQGHIPVPSPCTQPNLIFGFTAQWGCISLYSSMALTLCISQVTAGLTVYFSRTWIYFYPKGNWITLQEAPAGTT